MILAEERLKDTIMAVMADYGQKGMTIGTQYYVLKDVLNTIEKMYQQYIQENIEQAQKEIEEGKNIDISLEEEKEIE